MLFFSLNAYADSNEKAAFHAEDSEPRESVVGKEAGKNMDVSNSEGNGGAPAPPRSVPPVSPKSVPQSRTCLYYTVLMDQRDWRHVVSPRYILS